MKKLTLFLTALTAAAALSAQEIKSDIAADFSKAKFTGKLNVVLVKSDKNALDATLHNTDTDRISWDVKGGELHVRLKVDTRRAGSADVKLYYKDLTEITAVGARVKAEESVEKGIIAVSAAAGGVVSLEVDAKDVTVKLDGNSAVMLTGGADYLDVHASSKSKVDARSLETMSATVKALYGSEVFVQATDKLDAKAASGSIIYYKGTPEVLKVSEKMMGEVELMPLE